jgi:hypothetical protein
MIALVGDFTRRKILDLAPVFVTGLNKTCYSWRLHPEVVGDEQVQRRHRCRALRGHDGEHDCGRLPCIAFAWRRWVS